MMLELKTRKYKNLAEKLYEKCQEMQAQNERFVHRINNIKKLLRRRQREANLLKSRLDKYNDPWRTLPMVAPHPKRKIEQKRGPKPKAKAPEDAAKVKKVRKQRTKKGPFDVSSEISAVISNQPSLPFGMLHSPQQHPHQHHIQSTHLGNQF